MRLVLAFLVIVAIVAAPALAQQQAKGKPPSGGSIFYNFNDGTARGWIFPFNDEMTQCPGGGVWSVENGTLVQSCFGDNNPALVANLVLSSQTVQVQMSSGGYAGIVLWYNPDQVDSPVAEYVSVVRNAAAGTIWVTETFTDGTYKRTSYDDRWWGGDWCDLKVEADSNTGVLQISLDDPLWGQYAFTHTVSTPHRSGLSGVFSGNAYGYFDNFRLTFARERGRPR